MKRSTLVWIILLFSIAYSALIYANAIQIAPIRLTLSAKKPVKAMTITNQGNDTAVLQLQAMRWTQQNGNDIYQPSKDLIASPPIMTIAPHKSQIVRLALRKNTPSDNEIAYRVYIQEVPQAQHKNDEGDTVVMLLRFGVPVFILPSTKIQQNLQWQTKRLGGGQVQIKLVNSSNVHIEISHLNLVDLNTKKILMTTDTFAYLLPGQSKTWQVKSTAIKDKAVQITANTDWGVVSANSSL